MRGNILYYHHETSYDPRKLSGHGIDWKRMPSPFKIYPGVKTRLFPKDIDIPHIDPKKLFLSKSFLENKSEISFRDIGKILLLAYTITEIKQYPSGPFAFRSAPSAGALYPCEIYIATEKIHHLEPAIYHYSIEKNGLTPIRKGDFTPYISSGIPSQKSDPVVFFIITVIFYRSAWKYGERAYRYLLLDTGHLLENLSLALKAAGYHYSIYLDFDDEKINRIIRVNEEQEASIVVVSIDRSTRKKEDFLSEDTTEIPIDIESGSLDKTKKERGIDFPLIKRIHSLSSNIHKPKETIYNILDEFKSEEEYSYHITNQLDCPWEYQYPHIVFKRRSKRNFIRRAITFSCFSNLLNILEPKYCILPEKISETLLPLLIVENVEGLQPGIYLFDFYNNHLKLLKKGSFISDMASICLGQKWLAKASIHMLFITNLKKLEEIWGTRGYRYSMILAGMMGERLYLGSTGMGLGCCGIGAFFDYRAQRLLNLQKDTFMIYLLAVSHVRSYDKH